MRRWLVLFVLCALTAFAGVAPAEAGPAAPGDRSGASGAARGASAAARGVRADFNADEAEDVAIGASVEAVGIEAGAGAIHVLYGTPDGLSGAGSQLFHQDVGAIGSTAESWDDFGAALAVGDFDDDGYDDLAVGAPGETVGTADSAGAVNVLYGSPQGLTTSGTQLFTRASLGGGRTSQPDDRFGASLAAGDLDGDGADDLAVGTPFGNGCTGAVHVLHGGSGGLTTGRPTLTFTQDTAGVGGTAEGYDRFGAALAIADLNGSGVADLAVGVPGDTVGGNVWEAGAVDILFGRTSGISGASSQHLTQATPGVGSDPEGSDVFGAALAAADLDGDGAADLAVGVPGESVGTVAAAGAVNVLYGGTGGLQTTGGQLFHQDVAGVGGGAERDDRFGAALAAGDVDASGAADLLVGTPDEDAGSAGDAGLVHVLLGGNGGLSPAQRIDQDTAGVESVAQAGDHFGFSLAVADSDGDGAADAVVGVIGEAVNGQPAAGAVNLFAGTPGTGLTGGALLTQDSPGVGSAAEEGDAFGVAAAGPRP